MTIESLIVYVIIGAAVIALGFYMRNVYRRARMIEPERGPEDTRPENQYHQLGDPCPECGIPMRYFGTTYFVGCANYGNCLESGLLKRTGIKTKPEDKLINVL